MSPNNKNEVEEPQGERVDKIVSDLQNELFQVASNSDGENFNARLNRQRNVIEKHLKLALSQTKREAEVEASRLIKNSHTEGTIDGRIWERQRILKIVEGMRPHSFKGISTIEVYLCKEQNDFISALSSRIQEEHE